MGATVLWAGLYWGGDTTAGQGGNPAPNRSLRNQVRFETPATGGFVNLAGTLIGSSTYNGDDYQAFIEVTAMVQAGGSGTYRVANVQAGTGRDHNAGWGLVVVCRDPSQPTRNLTVFDGFATVSTDSPNVTIDVSGFLAPHSGPVNTRIGVVVYEGDVALVGDQMRLNGLNLSDALNPGSNFFNSSITRLGNRVTAKIPDYVNQLGFDIDTVDASGILPNRATSATINLTSSSDLYYPGVVAFVTDLHSPDLVLMCQFIPSCQAYRRPPQ